MKKQTNKLSEYMNVKDANKYAQLDSTMHLLNVVIQLTRIADTLEEQNKIAKLKINLSENEINSIEKSVSYGGTDGD